MDDGRCSYFFLLYPYNYPNYDVTSNDITKGKHIFQYREHWSHCFFAFFSWLVFKYEEFVHSIHLLLVKNSKQPQLDWVGDRFLVYRFIGRAEYYHVGLKDRYFFFSVYRKNNRDE